MRFGGLNLEASDGDALNSIKYKKMEKSFF
jgi:hypothetical protein